MCLVADGQKKRKETSSRTTLRVGGWPSAVTGLGEWGGGGEQGEMINNKQIGAELQKREKQRTVAHSSGIQMHGEGKRGEVPSRLSVTAKLKDGSGPSDPAITKSFTPPTPPPPHPNKVLGLFLKVVRLFVSRTHAASCSPLSLLRPLTPNCSQWMAAPSLSLLPLNRVFFPFHYHQVVIQS